MHLGDRFSGQTVTHFVIGGTSRCRPGLCVGRGARPSGVDTRPWGCGPLGVPPAGLPEAVLGASVSPPLRGAECYTYLYKDFGLFVTYLHKDLYLFAKYLDKHYDGEGT